MFIDGLRSQLHNYSIIVINFPNVAEMCGNLKSTF